MSQTNILFRPGNWPRYHSTKLVIKSQAILLGHVLQIQEAEVREAVLDIVRYLPARSVNEIKMVLSLAEGTSDERIQRACAVALERSRPKTSDDWAALELGKQSSVRVVREAVERRLERKR